MTTYAVPGADAAFTELVERHRRELRLHCYRITGSLTDADDLVQETFLAAWRGLDRFEGRSSVRTWLYRIATNRSLNALRTARRGLPRTPTPLPPPTRTAEATWLHPFPDALLDQVAAAGGASGGAPGSAPEPETRYETREAVGLAFTTLLQHLPARQRAAVVLVDVLAFRLSEAAEILDTTAVAVKAMLQRARAALDARRGTAPAAGGVREREVAALFAAALETGDVDGIVSLLTDDAWLTMPPQPHEYRGAAVIGAFLAERSLFRKGPPRVIPTRANGQPAFACYLPGGDGVARPFGILVVTVAEGGIAMITGFHDTAVFPLFGLPPSL